jgi:guanylate cyclase
MTILSSLISLIGWIGADQGDSNDIRLRKTILVSGSLLIILAAAVWGAIYLLYNEPLASLISFGYAIVTLAGLVLLHRTRRYRGFLFVELLLGLVLPFIHTLVLGGFWNSGMVFVWSILSPLGTLVFYKYEHSRWWWGAYLVLLAVGAAIQPQIQHPNNLPQEIVRAYFVLNLGSVSVIIFLLLTYFIRQKDQAYRLLHIEEEKAENLLLNILPKEIAAILKNEDRTIADSFEGVSILFADLVGFTQLTANMAPVDVVNLLNEIFSYFDSLVEKYDVEKIRTIGDNYMVAAGAPRQCPDHACRLASMALEMQAYLQERHTWKDIPIRFRIGINSGPVIGGVIGRKKFVYDIWGDAVNIASRMESQGVAGKIQLTGVTYEMIRDRFACERRGTVEVKGRGDMETWFLVGFKGKV